MSEGIYRNIFAHQIGKHYSRIQFKDLNTNGNLLAANNHFLAVSWNTLNGGIAIFDSNHFSESSSKQKLILGHSGDIFDIKFSPFRSDLLASCSKDTTIKLWKIPEEGLKEDITKEVQVYTNHSIRPCFLEFHPLVEDVIASASLDTTLQIWNIIKSEPYVNFQIEKEPWSLDWNEGGSLIGVSTSDKKIRIFDPRASKEIISIVPHKRNKIMKLIWVGQNNFASVGFSLTGQRELKHWDMRKINEESDLDSALETVKIDEGMGVLTPFYDHESKILYIAAKGEGSMHTYDFNGEKIKHTFHYKCKDRAFGITMFDRNAVDYNKCEIDKFAKVTSNNKIIYESFYVFRKEYIYDPKLYPYVPCGEPSMTYDEWIAGENKGPKMVEINQLNRNFITKEDKFEKIIEKKVNLRPEEELAELQKKLNELECGITALSGSNSLYSEFLEKEQIKNEKLKKKLEFELQQEN